MAYDDLYWDFKALASAVKYDKDYHIMVAERNSNIAYITPHGGGIETGCTELCVHSAGLTDNYYIFEGSRTSNNGELHITSTHFDEPNCLEMMAHIDYAVSYHGYSDSSLKNTKIGGMDEDLKQLVLANLISAGFGAETEGNDSVIAGQDDRNVVNSTRRGKGLQLELSTAQRTAFFDVNTKVGRRTSTNQEFRNYVKVIVDTVNAYART